MKIDLCALSDLSSFGPFSWMKFVPFSPLLMRINNHE